MPSKSKALTTVHNALALLDAFTLERPEWGVRELAREHELPQATASRLVGTLCNEGFLAQTPAKRYRLNMALQEIGLTAARGADLYAVALPELVRVRCATDLATTLSVLDGLDVVFLERLGTCEGEKLRSPRKRWPAYTTAGGKAILAFSPPALLDDALRGHKQRASLMHALEHIRADGYATEFEESQPELSSIGVPIFDTSGTAAGALAVEAWQTNWHDVPPVKTIRLMRDAAAAIGAELV